MHSNRTRDEKLCTHRHGLTTVNQEIADELVRVVLVDDHVIFREGTRALLARDPSIHVVGEAGAVTDALRVIREAEPDIALVDIKLGSGNGIDLVRAVKRDHPKVKTIVLTAYEHTQYVRAMARAGVRGYLLKDCAGTELVRALHDVHEGRVALATSVGATLMDLMAEQVYPRQQIDDLTIRELEVLEMLEGSTNRQIAQRLGVSIKTINTHVAHILSKLGEPSRNKAVAKGRTLGLLESRIDR